MGMSKSKKRSFRWAKELLNVPGFYLQHIVVIMQDVHSMDLTDPFDYDCQKQCWS